MRAKDTELGRLRELTEASSPELVKLALECVPYIVAELEERRATFDKIKNNVMNTLEHYAREANWRRDSDGTWKWIGRSIDGDPTVRARSSAAAILLEVVDHEIRMANNVSEGDSKGETHEHEQPGRGVGGQSTNN